MVTTKWCAPGKRAGSKKGGFEMGKSRDAIDLEYLKKLVRDIESGKVALMACEVDTKFLYLDETRYQTGTPHLRQLSQRLWEKSQSFVIVTSGVGDPA